MAPSEADAPRQIAQRAQEHKLLFLGLSLSLQSLFDPGLPILRSLLQLNGVPPDGDMPVILRDQRDGALSFSAREILTKFAALRGEVVGHDLLSLAMLVGATRVWEMIKEAELSSPHQPLLQFARHFRNAAAHGDRWEFRGSEPEHPAACRDLVLTKDLNGVRATWITVMPRRYVEFLDDISNHFLPGSVAPPRTTH